MVRSGIIDGCRRADRRLDLGKRHRDVRLHRARRAEQARRFLRPPVVLGIRLRER
jgi:hypothetical protein